MPKIKIKTKLSNENDTTEKKELVALKNDNKIVFYEDNNTLMKILFFPNKISIERDYDDTHIQMFFQKKKEMIGKYEIKSLQMHIDLRTITKDFIIEEKKFKIAYDLYIENEYSGSFTYDLEWSD